MLQANIFDTNEHVNATTEAMEKLRKRWSDCIALKGYAFVE